MWVRLCTQPNYVSCHTFYSSDNNLAEHYPAINDTVWSVELSPGATVAFYRDPLFQVCYGVLTASTPTRPLGDQAASSFKLGATSC